FPKNATTRTITVYVNGDTVFEADQTFLVTLSNESGATILDGTGRGTITNDDIETTSLTLGKRLVPKALIAKGLLERATPAAKVRVALFRLVNGRWVRLRVKVVIVKKIKDRDGDGIPDGRYRAVFTRPTTHGRYKLRARFAGSATQKRAKRRLRFRL